MDLLRERLADRRLRKLIDRTPRVSIGELAEDTLGRFAGRVRPLDKRLMEAPLSSRLCVYYDVSVDALSETGFAGVLATEQDALSFIVDDHGQRAVVDPAHAQISAGYDYIAEISLRDSQIDARQKALLVRLGLIGRRKAFMTGLRFREAILEADEDVIVLGAGIREPDPQAPQSGYRHTGQTRLRLTGSERHPLVISDDPRSF